MIRDVEEELRHPFKDRDVNYGASRSNEYGESMTGMLITIDSDRRFNSLKRQYDVITRALEDADDETATIIRKLYIKPYCNLNIEGLIMQGKIWSSRTTANRLRTAFIEKVAHEMGMYDN